MSSALAFTLLYVMAFLGIGLLSSRLMKLIHFPNVTGYLVSGILFGPFVLGAIVDQISQFRLIWVSMCFSAVP
jgi:Kef-type K+ transport system membrane component KefB